MIADKKLTSRRVLSPEQLAVKVELLKRGLTQAEFARKLGLTPDSFKAAFYDGLVSEALRLRIESFFDCKLQLWSSPAFLAKRRRCIECLGFDPCLLNVEELKARGPAAKADFSQCQIREDFVDELFARAAVTPKMSAQTDP